MTSVPPPSKPPASLHTHPEVPAGVVPAPVAPADGDGRSSGLGAVPAWALLAALLSVFVVAAIAFALIALVIEAAGGAVTANGPPGLVISATLIQDVALVVAAVMFASIWVRGVTPATLGLRRVALRPGVGWAALAFAAFWVLTAIVVTLLGKPDEQDLTRDLRGEEALTALIGYGVLLAFVAPLTEEIFFRGFVFGVLREKLGKAWGAVTAGSAFGLIHLPSSPIVSVVVLCCFGILLCLLYQRTGSLLPSIALHAVNNSISFAATKSLAWPEGAAVVLLSTGASVAVAAAVTQRRALFSRD